MSAYGSAVERLSRVDGVRGALIVELETAVPVVAELADDVNGTAVAALAASLYHRSAQASASARFGTLHTLQLEAESGHVFAIGAGDVILVVVAERHAQLGLVRLEAQRAAESLT